MTALYELDRAALADLLDGEPSFRVDQVWHGLYRELAEPSALTTLPGHLRTRLAHELVPSLDPVVEQETDDGQTVKWLYELHDARRIETVLMHYESRSTVCISSQAGCAMACGFCATGQSGFDRQLSTAEIVEQYIRAQRRAGQRRVSNVVFMGMGEPLANFDRVWAAIERLHDDIGLGARNITVSTVGVVPGIYRLTAAGLPVNLAVSLHAANDQLRETLVPLNKRYPLAMLIEACRDFFETTGRRLSFEWALIDGVNDSDRDADELSAIALDLQAHVNVIPLNPTPGYLVRGSDERAVGRFTDRLGGNGVNVTVRSTRGVEIDAACGQLARRGQPVRLRKAAVTAD